jgi:uncharacterized membrane protein YjgN (DUF898 family)
MDFLRRVLGSQAFVFWLAMLGISALVITTQPTVGILLLLLLLTCVPFGAWVAWKAFGEGDWRDL